MSGIINISRRDFLKAGALLGGGLILGVSLGGPRAEAGEDRAESIALNAFVRIGPDNTVTIILNHSEMGQGVYTALPMLVAEELECDWKKIIVKPAPLAPVYNHTVFGMQMTGGSTSVWSEYDRLRKVGAAARLMLIAAAADTWKVAPSACHAENGFVIHDSTGKKLSYGRLAERASRLEVPENVPLKRAKDFSLIGRPLKRLDTPQKTNGKAVFGIDVKIPGMLTAVIARPPVFGATVKSINMDKALKVPGVKKIVSVGAGVAVAAENFWAAKKGRDALEVVWNEGEGASISTDSLRDRYRSLAKKNGTVARKDGDPEEAFSKAAKRLDAEYEVPYLAHACMEPLNCVVDLRAGHRGIWTGTQFQSVDRDAAARETGLRPGQISINTTFLGGGFGRRANPKSDFVLDAVQVAKAIRKPVKVVWTREDDMKGGYYRPMWHDRISAGLDENGNLIAWHHTVVGQSIMAGSPFEKMIKGGIDPASVEGAKDIPYSIPNVLVDLHSPKVGVPVQWWRSVGHSHTAFVVESFIDEVAHAAGKDPLEFRRGLLASKPRHIGVLELAARESGWGKPLPMGRARGIAVHDSFGSFIAQVAEVSVDPGGAMRVHRVVCAVDCGKTVNPGIIKAQMESAMVFGLSATLHSAITLKDGKVEQDNFDTYEVLRLREMPLIEVHIVSSGEKPGGIGEPGVPPVAPAVCNAVFALAGRRIRRLPIRVEELRKA